MLLPLPPPCCNVLPIIIYEYKLFRPHTPSLFYATVMPLTAVKLFPCTLTHCRQLDSLPIPYTSRHVHHPITSYRPKPLLTSLALQDTYFPFAHTLSIIDLLTLHHTP